MISDDFSFSVLIRAQKASAYTRGGGGTDSRRNWEFGRKEGVHSPHVIPYGGALPEHVAEFADMVQVPAGMGRNTSKDHVKKNQCFSGVKRVVVLRGRRIPSPAKDPEMHAMAMMSLVPPVTAMGRLPVHEPDRCRPDARKDGRWELQHPDDPWEHLFARVQELSEDAVAESNKRYLVCVCSSPWATALCNARFRGKRVVLS